MRSDRSAEEISKTEDGPCCLRYPCLGCFRLLVQVPINTNLGHVTKVPFYINLSNREAEAKLKQLLDGHGLSSKEGNNRSRQGVVLGGAVTRSLDQLPASRLAASLDNLPGSRLPPRPASAVRRQLFPRDGGDVRDARLRSRWHIICQILVQSENLAGTALGTT